MKLASHLKRSPYGVYYFRWVVPSALRPLHQGQREVKRSLHTRDPATARRLAYMLWAQTQERLREAKRAMSGFDPKKFNPNDPSTWHTSAGKKWVAEVGGITITADPNVPGDSESARAALMDVISRQSDMASLSRHDGELIAPIDHADSATSNRTPLDTTIKFSQARDIYLQLIDKETHLAEKTRLEMKSVFEHFLKWTKNPHDPQLSKIDQDMIERYMNHLLLEVPNKRTKKKGLSQATVKKNLSFLHGLFQKRKSDFPKGYQLPTVGVTPFRRGTQKKVQRANRYLPFNPAELKKIFAAESFLALKKPHEFWCPLLGLYLGARLEEICQLRQSDIEKQGGLMVIHIREDEIGSSQDNGGDDNTTSLKTEHSERSIPLHKDLIELGFLDYLEDAKRAAPNGRLFPYLHSGVNGFYDVPSEAFARYLDKIGITNNKKTFHSFRSTINTHLQDLRVALELRCHYLGQSVDSINVLHYGKDKPNVKTLDELVVSKITVKRWIAEFSKLKYLAGRFAPILQSEMTRRERDIKRKEYQAVRKELQNRRSKR